MSSPLSLNEVRARSAVFEWALADFPANADRLSFIAGYQATPATRAEQEAASVKAARLMAGSYEALESEGLAEHDASVFLVRTLFCLYADDAGVWQRDLFLSYQLALSAEKPRKRSR
jgi:hypothetical protein